MTRTELEALFVSTVEGIRRSQRKTLAGLVWGLMQGMRVGVQAIGRAMAGPVAPKHNIKRVDRFLGNPRVRIGAALPTLVNWLVTGRSRVYVAVDWTDTTDGCHQTLAASVVTRSRSLPLWWQTVRTDALALRRNRIEEAFLTQLRALIPAAVEVVVVMDRGFARAALLDWLPSAGLSYVLRVTGQVWVSCAAFRGRWDEHLRLRRGQVWDGGRGWYHRTPSVATRLVAYWGVGHDEPWLLVTNLADPAAHVVAHYRRRMEIEAWFKDTKNAKLGFGLRGLRLSTAARYDRLFLVLAFAYVLLVLAGQQAEQQGVHRRMMANTVRHKRTVSLWKVGWYFLQHAAVALRPLLTLAPTLAYDGVQTGDA